MAQAEGFGAESTAAEVVAGHDLSGRNVVVTGGATGIGFETARVLAGAGARVVVATRNRERGEEAVGRLRAGGADVAGGAGSGEVVFAPLDLASLASVDAFVSDWLASGRPLHLLVNNAGVMACPFGRTADGFETQFGTNHLGHFALTRGLLPALRAAGSARVVAVSSRAHRRSDIDFDDPNYERRPYDAWQAYGQSKTANMLFAVALTAHHAAEGITSNSLMPGAIRTDLQRHLPEEVRATPFAGEKTVPQGAATTVWAALATELDGVGGRYLENCAIAEPWTGEGEVRNGYYLPYGLDPEHAERLWQLSARLTGR